MERHHHTASRRSVSVELGVGGVVMARRPQILGWVLVNESAACSLMTSPVQLRRA